MKQLTTIYFLVLIIVSCKNPEKAYKPVEPKQIEFETKIPLDEALPDSNFYHIKFSFTAIANYEDTEILEKVRQQLNRQFFNAEKLDFSTDVNENIQTLVKAITPAYREECLNLKREMGDIVGSYTLNYELIRSSKIIYNNNYFLSFEIESYVYAGGAHGLPNMKYLHFNMKTGDTVGIDDIFSPESKLKLSEILENKKNEMEANGINVFFDDARIEAIDNFYFKDNVLCFVYNPYEIGPFSSGFITIEVPADEIKPLLLNESPVSFLNSSVKTSK
ncbi:MAG: DUF3298 domain-containing protein [Bacteroidales bacterium]